MSNSPLSLEIESILFYHGGSMRVGDLARMAHSSPSAVSGALNELMKSLEGRGIRLVKEGDAVGLTTAPESAARIESIRRDEIEGPLGRAGLETLAVIMYRGSVTRADIEYIRGVHVSHILRALTIRGLVERTENPSDKRSFLYRATSEVPAYLGISEISDLPEYSAVVAEIETVLKERDQQPTINTGAE